MTTRTALGTDNFKASGGTSRTIVSSVTLGSNETLLVGLAAINALGWTFGCRLGTTNVPADIFPDGTSPRINLFRLVNYTDTPITEAVSVIVVGHTFSGAYAAWASKYDSILGLDNTASASGTGTAADSGNVSTLTTSEQVLTGCFGMQGPIGDAAPTITGGSEVDNLGQRDGTSGGSDTSNCTIVESYGSISSNATINAAITLGVSRAWQGSALRYVVLPPGPPGPFDDITCVG